MFEKHVMDSASVANIWSQSQRLVNPCLTYGRLAVCSMPLSEQQSNACSCQQQKNLCLASILGSQFLPSKCRFLPPYSNCDILLQLMRASSHSWYVAESPTTTVCHDRIRSNVTPPFPSLLVTTEYAGSSQNSHSFPSLLLSFCQFITPPGTISFNWLSWLASYSWASYSFGSILLYHPYLLGSQSLSHDSSFEPHRPL